MVPLDFLYIALGIGFIILVIFLCVMLLNLTLVLRDVTKMTGNFKDVSEKVRDVVMDPLKTISEMSASFGFVHNIVEKIRARFEEVEAGEGECENCGEEDCFCEKEQEKEKAPEKPKKKGFFSVKKLGK
jgi:hypothetical protein